MIFETKFNRGDLVYTIFQGRIEVGAITDVTIKNFNGGDLTTIHYARECAPDDLDTPVSNRGDCEESMYSTKQEAGEVWMKRQNLKVGLTDV